MKFVTFETRSAPPQPGVLRTDGTIAGLGETFPRLLDLIDAGPEGLAVARRAAERPSSPIPLADAVLLAPLPRPRQIRDFMLFEKHVRQAREQNQRQGLIVGTITLPFRLLGVLIGSLLFSIVVECVGMHLFWKDQGWRHSRQMLQYELGHLSNHFTRSVVVQEPGRTAHQLVDTGYEWVFVRSGLLERTSQTAERARAPSLGKSQDGVRNFRYYISQVYVWAESYLIAAAFTTLTFLVRLLVLVLTLPLILTAAFVGLIDGLVRRDVRRFGAGRESGFIYHRAKASLMPLAVLPWVTYLALPISVHPLVILLPSAALLGLAVSLTAGSFKKYL